MAEMFDVTKATAEECEAWLQAEMTVALTDALTECVCASRYDEGSGYVTFYMPLGPQLPEVQAVIDNVAARDNSKGG